jgi:hypothetical protein
MTPPTPPAQPPMTPEEEKAARDSHYNMGLLIEIAKAKGELPGGEKDEAWATWAQGLYDRAERCEDAEACAEKAEAGLAAAKEEIRTHAEWAKNFAADPEHGLVMMLEKQLFCLREWIRRAPHTLDCHQGFCYTRQHYHSALSPSQPGCDETHPCDCWKREAEGE